MRAIDLPAKLLKRYYFVLDQDNDTNVATADITIKKDDSQTGLAENDVQVNPGSGTRNNNIVLSPANGTLGNGSFSAADLCGRIKHEMAHLIGLGNNSLCNTIKMLDWGKYDLGYQPGNVMSDGQDNMLTPSVMQSHEIGHALARMIGYKDGRQRKVVEDAGVDMENKVRRQQFPKRTDL